MGHETTFLSAWAQWLFDGMRVADDILWGRPIWWWARWGKVLQFFAAALVVVELIGAARLNTWAHAVARTTKEQRPRAKLNTVGMPFLRFAAVTWVVPIATIALISETPLADMESWPYNIGATLTYFLTGAWFIAVVVTLAPVVTILGYFVLWPFLRLHAKITASPLIERHSKAVALILFTGGFIFDLLAS